jgi:uncharacterized membrane protein
MDVLLHTAAGRAVTAAVVVVAGAVAAGLVLLWPGEERAEVRPPAAGAVVRADVERVTAGGCEETGGPGCSLARVRLRDGGDAGRPALLAIPGGELAPPVRAGDTIRVARNDGAAGGLGDPAGRALAFVDFDRRTPLLGLAALFALLVIALGRWQGVRSLVGLGASLAVVAGFIVPAMLAGGPPLLVALVGGLAVMLLTIALTHGVGLKSAAAVLGTTAALLLTALLAVAATGVASITGLSSEEGSLLQATGEGRLSLQGLVIAGMVIGALGVLDDVTVTQASVTLSLRRADGGAGLRRLFGEAMAVGRDHVGAVVNTLVLAYVGAALPVLLIFSTAGTTLDSAVNREPVAEEIVSMLVGSIGLVAAVPITTALAAVLAVRIPAAALPRDAHAHAHG